jgi:hypothetical protein
VEADNEIVQQLTAMGKKWYCVCMVWYGSITILRFLLCFIGHGTLIYLLLGFSENGCKRAAIAVSNENVEAAMNWIFEHMEDPGKSP